MIILYRDIEGVRFQLVFTSLHPRRRDGFTLSKLKKATCVHTAISTMAAKMLELYREQTLLALCKSRCWHCQFRDKYEGYTLCRTCLYVYRKDTFKVMLPALENNWCIWYAATRYLDFLVQQFRTKEEMLVAGPMAVYSAIIVYGTQEHPSLEKLQTVSPELTEEQYEKIKQYQYFLNHDTFAFHDVYDEFVRIDEMGFPQRKYISAKDIQTEIQHEMLAISFLGFDILEGIQYVFNILLNRQL